MNGVIEIENMEFYAYHGCFEAERVVGNRYLVYARLEYDCATAAASDRVEDALNYQTAYGVIAKEMAVPSHLLEHVAHRILEALREAFPQLEKATVKVSKMNPPLGGQVGCTSVTLEG